MTRYYNRTRGPLAATLRDGRVFAFPPKKWSEVEPRDEGCEALVNLVRSGDLIRSSVGDLPPAPAPAPAPARVSAPARAPEKVAAPAPKAAADPQPEPSVTTAALPEVGGAQLSGTTPKGDPKLSDGGTPRRRRFGG